MDSYLGLEIDVYGFTFCIFRCEKWWGVLLLALKVCSLVDSEAGHGIYLQVDKPPTLTKTREGACQVFSSVTAPSSWKHYHFSLVDRIRTLSYRF